jgi:hypothetical protein
MPCSLHRASLKQRHISRYRHPTRRAFVSVCSWQLRAVPQRDEHHSLKLLNLSSVSGMKDLKQAYHGCIRQLHPDVNPDRDTTKDAAAVNKAYQVLSEVCPSHGILCVCHWHVALQACNIQLGYIQMIQKGL